VVGKSVQFVWDILTNTLTAAKNLQLVWNTKAPVGKSLQTVWNVLTVVRVQVLGLDQLAANGVNGQFVDNSGWTFKNTSVLSNVSGAMRIGRSGTSGFAEAETFPDISVHLPAGNYKIRVRWRTSGPNYAGYVQLIGGAAYLLDNSAQSTYSIIEYPFSTSGPGDTITHINMGTNQSIGTFQYLEVDWLEIVSLTDDIRFKWDIKSSISKSLQAVWNIRQAIGKSNQLVWNTRAAIGKSLELDWQTLTLAGKSLIVRWNVRTSAGKSAQLVWNVREAVGKDLTLVWDTDANFIWTEQLTDSLTWTPQGPDAQVWTAVTPDIQSHSEASKVNSIWTPAIPDSQVWN
jgi:hypothetical protein